MKTFFSLILAIGLLNACNPQPVSRTVVENTGKHVVAVENGNVSIVYYTVKIDGKDYLATRTYNGYWTLCPKQNNL